MITVRSSARTARPLWLWLMACGGCLYVGGINHAPEAEVELDPEQSALHVAGRAVLRVRASDPDDDTLTYRWRAWGTDLAQQPFVVAAAHGEVTAGSDPPVIGTAEQLELVLAVRGRYEVALEVRDPEGAVVQASTTFAVDNRAPQVSLELTSIDAAPAEDTHPALGRHVVSAARSTDDDDLSCGGGATVDWRLIRPERALFEIWRVLPCTGGEILDKLELRAVTGAVTQPVQVEIEAEVRDPQGATGTGRLTFELQPNRPPCLRGTQPEVDAEAKVVAISGEATDAPLRFVAIEVDDDVQDQTRFGWLVAQQREGPYRLMVEDSRSFELPADQAPPGQVRFVRVRVDDPLAGEPACEASEPLCGSGEGACLRWVTWEVVFR